MRHISLPPATPTIDKLLIVPCLPRDMLYSPLIPEILSRPPLPIAPALTVVDLLSQQATPLRIACCLLSPPIQPAIPRRIAGYLTIKNYSDATYSGPTGFGVIGLASRLAAFPPCPDLAEVPSGGPPGSINATSVPPCLPEPVSSSTHNYSLSTNQRKSVYYLTTPHVTTPIIP